MLQQIISNSQIAIEAIKSNPTRSLLTTLGVVFGVASVIAMVAIGEGTQQQIMRQLEAIGSNQVVVKVKEEKTENQSPKGEVQTEIPAKRAVLTITDIQNLRKLLKNDILISAEVVQDYRVNNKYKKATIKLVGVEKSYFEIQKLSFEKGISFSKQNYQKGDAVCIIGKGVANQLFSTENPIGKYLKCGGRWLKVAGVLEQKKLDEDLIQEMSLINSQWAVYIPLKTSLLRFPNLYQQTNLQNVKRRNEVEKILIQVKSSDRLPAVLAILQKFLVRTHPNENFDITVPEELIAQQQKAKEVFNIVLGAIAGISLLVGGVGITNIMYASVSERSKEIGVRRVVGATKQDITIQFLAEAVFICFIGGFIGVVLGWGLGWTISKVADIPTIITIGSMFWAFSIASAIGIIFGLKPAQKAANRQPIEAIRYE